MKYLPIVFLTIALSACGGGGGDSSGTAGGGSGTTGGGSGTTGGGSGSQAGDRVAYIAYDQSTIDTDNLYVVDTDGVNPSKLNPDLAGGGNVIDFVWSADGSRVIYIADQEQDERLELYSILADGTGLIKLNGTLLDSAGVSDFKLSPTGDVLAYLARQEANDTTELYTVSLDGTNNVHVNEAVVADGNVTEFMWSPDGESILYLADLEVDERFELYTAGINGSNHRNVNADLGSDEMVVDYQWSPLGGYISYTVSTEDISLNLAFETKSLFAFNMSNGSVATVLNSRVIQNHLWNADETMIAIADKDDIPGISIVNIGAYSTIWVNSPDGSSLVEMTQMIPKELYLNSSLREAPMQFDFDPGTGNLLILVWDRGGSYTTNFYVVSSVDGTIIDVEAASGLGGGFLNYQFGLNPDGLTLTQEDFVRYYEQEKYAPFTYSPDGRYIVINDFALSIYDTQTNMLLELAPLNFIRTYNSYWIEADNTLLYFYGDGSYDPQTYKRYFIEPIVVSPLGAVIADIDQLLGGNVAVARAVNPVLLDDSQITFERFPTTEKALVMVGTGGQNITVLSEESVVEIVDYQLSKDGDTVVYLKGCGNLPLVLCTDAELYSVEIDDTNSRSKINPDLFTSTGVKSFAVQP